jgi:hypothetical protein
MEPEASPSWLALTMTPGIAARLSARLLNEFGSPENVFRGSLTALEASDLPAPVVQAIFKKQTFWRGKRKSRPFGAPPVVCCTGANRNIRKRSCRSITRPWCSM